MSEWLLSLLIGGVIMGLVGVIYKQMLTKSEHAKLCHSNALEIQRVLKEELSDMKEYFNVKIERDILKEIRNLNGKG